MDELKKTTGGVPPYAVRWADRKYAGEWDFTTWHESRDGRNTVCGRYVKHDAKRVETDDVSRRDCGQCKRRV